MKPRDAFLILMITAVLLLVTEGVARLMLPHPETEQAGRYRRVIIPDNLLHHKWNPSGSFERKAHGIRYMLYTNSQSWVEREDTSKAKPEGVFRIFYLGDSSTQGVVPPGDRLADIVETELNAGAGGGRRYEVINTGTSSYSIFMYYLLATRVLPDYAPDLLIINVDMTDLANDCAYEAYTLFDDRGLPERIVGVPDRAAEYVLTPFGIEKKPLRLRIRILLNRHSRLFSFLYSFFPEEDTGKLHRAQRRLWAPQPMNDESCNWLATTVTANLEEKTAYSMRVLSAAITFWRERGVPVVVTGVPHYLQYEGSWSTRPHAVLARTTTEAGGHYLDSYETLAPLIRGSVVTDYYWANDPTHFNQAGNRIWAEAQLAFLRRGDLLGRAGASTVS